MVFSGFVQIPSATLFGDDYRNRRRIKRVLPCGRRITLAHPPAGGQTLRQVKGVCGKAQLLSTLYQGAAFIYTWREQLLLSRAKVGLDGTSHDYQVLAKNPVCVTIPDLKYFVSNK